MAARGGAPMSKWKQDALVALQGKLKENLTMTQLCDMLEKPADGFMSHAEAIRVTELSGDSNQVGQIIKILRGKGDNEFDTFCKMLRCCNYDVWANKLESEAETFKNGQDSPDEKQSRVDKLEDEVKVVKQTLAVTTKVEGAQLKHINARLEQLEQQMQALTSQQMKVDCTRRTKHVERELAASRQRLKAKDAELHGAQQQQLTQLQAELKELTAATKPTPEANDRIVHTSTQLSQRTSRAPKFLEFTMTKNKEDYQFVVAADIGTAYTKVSWTPKRSPENVHLYDRWPGFKDKFQVPTAVLYRPVVKGRETEWEMHAFGQEAIDTYFQDEEADGFALFQNFKMKLHSQEKFGEAVAYRTIDGRTKVVRSLTLPALKVFSDVLQHLETVILKRLCEVHGFHGFTRRDLQWVLTVPAMWTACARDFMRQAARKANIYEIKSPRQLGIALEPESAALHIRSLRQEEYYAEQILNVNLYIVIDIGGGTIDIAVHKVHRHGDTGDEYIHEIEGCIGSDRGATCIDRAFEDFLCSLKVDGYHNFFKEMKRDPKLWSQLMCKFELGKTSFDGSRDMRIELPRRILDSYKEKTSKELASVLSKGASSKVFIGTSDYLRVSKDLCRTWYRPTIDSVVEQVQSLHKKYEANALFVVGGFAECVILKEELKVKFPDLHLMIPPLPGLAVIKGAVRYDLHPKAITSRVSHATYGVETSTAFIEGTHDPNKKFWCERDAGYHCGSIFSVFVKIGDEVNPAKPYTQSYYTVEPSQRTVTMDVYATDEENPMYVTDPGCKRIATMTIPVEPLPAGMKAEDDYREVTVQMDFSGSEIFVSSVDDSGNSDEKTLDFLPVKEYSRC